MLKEQSLQMLIALVNSMSQIPGKRIMTIDESSVYNEACALLQVQMKLNRLKGETDVERHNSQIADGP